MFLETDAEKAKVSNALVAHKATKPCPACGQTQRGIVDANEKMTFDFDVQVHGQSTSWTSKYVRVATLCCAGCGLISQFSLGVLGLWKPEDDPDSKPA
jgi:hypothetical protein